MRISVIMASYLEEYSTGKHKSATNREFKFRRAVDSFLKQTFKDAELIIVSDGCQKTSKITREEYSKNPQIQLVELNKQPLFSGTVRQNGLRVAKGEIICYLDSDDILGENHLAVINKFDDSSYSWCYYDDYIFDGKSKKTRQVQPKLNSIGTSSICHRNNSKFKWEDGYGHDWKSISNLLNEKHYKLETPEYIVCHIGKIDV
jgi:glycosyltransferase involved in cell wall biosynthesis